MMYPQQQYDGSMNVCMYACSKSAKSKAGSHLLTLIRRPPKGGKSSRATSDFLFGQDIYHILVSTFHKIMAENIPPAADATRGVPYYEKLKRDLRETLKKKHLLDKNMVPLPPPFPNFTLPFPNNE